MTIRTGSHNGVVAGVRMPLIKLCSHMHKATAYIYKRLLFIRDVSMDELELHAPPPPLVRQDAKWGKELLKVFFPNKDPDE